MLKTEHLSFRYSQQPWIVHDLSLELERGEVVGLTGPSGLGKTTIGKLLAGYLQPTQGKVTCDGQPLPNKGYCPVQLIFQNPELAVNPRWRINKILAEGQPPSVDLLASLGIHQSWLSRYPHELSGGELQRIAVARSLNSHTRYLIADEMTAMLDANTQALIWQVVIKYAREHEVGILAISHEAPLLKRLCVGVAGRRHRTIDLSTLIYQTR
ncbi:ABC transporter ATP-binding protein [Nostoc favosum]|uniref:ATP-binding cassette domain-containing protein n=1 Tax=Nostoc favosum CHAB5714 TaxID=2780399 RepID=A0ABS8IIK7_9NOSO|nr:ATP-binding cassette domain-containing protein [Nostoc favosum]MCC5604115.1 ATP-binding cassette domain-containing protein [Nostoc favosum CHAB5714]